MKIIQIETLLGDAGRCGFLFIKVRTDEGIEGVGEASLEGKEFSVQKSIEELVRYLIGEDPTKIEYLWQAMYRGGILERGGNST
jgi:galactonate dehydratase